MGNTQAKALLFDLYGIFMQEQDAAGQAEIERIAGLEERGVAPSDFWAAWERWRDALDAGTLSHVDYVTAVGHDLGVTWADPAAVAQADFDSYLHTKPDSISWLHELVASGVRPALLSNIIKSMKDKLLGAHDWLQLFEPRIFSCDVLLNKPDVRIYELALARINEVRAAHGEAPVVAADVLFLDDRERNLEGAREAGMQTYLFKDLESGRRAVAEFLG